MDLFFDLPAFIQAAGLIGITAIIFAECGLLIGIFFPGDSLLFTAGFLASQSVFDIKILVILSFLAAVAGNLVGYWIGAKAGPKMFSREESRFFKKEYVARAEHFFQSYGARAVLLSRFLPIIRTMVPLCAGVGHMDIGRFTLNTLIGAFLWAGVVPLLGYALGSVIPDVDSYLLPIIIGIVVLSILPTLLHIQSQRKK